MTPLPDTILRIDSHPQGAIYGLGTFDGVHRGHAYLIDRVLALGAELQLPACVLVLYRDPANPLFSGQQVITTEAERALIFRGTSLACSGILRLTTEVTGMAHDAFVRDVLLGQLVARHLVVGWDFHYGHARVGNVALLRDQLAREGAQCGVTVLDPVMDGAEPIKSTTIREWLNQGELERANDWLTVPYFIVGTVVEGQQLGRSIGFPTANVAFAPSKLIPAHGVYVTVAEIGGSLHWGATNVGTRPTVTGDPSIVTVETHILDFEGDLYGRSITLHFLQRLRPEFRFPDLAALQAQLQQDVAEARRYAATHPLSELPLIRC